MLAVGKCGTRVVAITANGVGAVSIDDIRFIRLRGEATARHAIYKLIENSSVFR